MTDKLPFDDAFSIQMGPIGEMGPIGTPGPDLYHVVGRAIDEKGGWVRIDEFVYSGGLQDLTEIALNQHISKKGLIVFDNPISPVLIWDHESRTSIQKINTNPTKIKRDISSPKIAKLHANIRRRLVLNRVKRDVRNIEYDVNRKPFMVDKSEYTAGYLQAWEDLAALITPYLQSIKHEIAKCPTQEE